MPNPSGGDVVGDAGLLSAEIEAELSELAVELSGEGLSEEGAVVSEKVDVALDVTELIVGQGVEPGGDFWLELHRNPSLRWNVVKLL